MLIEILPLLAGGLVLFIYSIARLSETMENLFSGKAQEVIQRYTSNALLGVVVGTVATILLGSSSAVIILTIVFINARTLNFKQAIGIILGANIGTTFSSQLITLDIGRFSVVPMFIGLAMALFSSTEAWKKKGNGMLYFGMLFFGLFVIESSVAPLRNSQVFLDWIAQLDHPVRGALTGGLVTLLIQSSSATVGLAIVLGKQNLLSLAGGIAVMLGAELGTCSDTLLATIKGSRQAFRAGVFHLAFNFTTIVIGLLLFQPFVSMIEGLFPDAPLNRQIAHAHVTFNVLGVLMALPFTTLADRALTRLIPEKSPHVKG